MALFFVDQLQTQNEYFIKTYIENVLLKKAYAINIKRICSV